MLTIDGKRLLDTVDIILSQIPSPPQFALMSSCVTRLETLGTKIFNVQNQIKYHLQNKPFIEYYVGGESTYSSEYGLDYMNMSFNTAVIGD